MLNFKIFLEMSPINVPKRGLYKKAVSTVFARHAMNIFTAVTGDSRTVSLWKKAESFLPSSWLAIQGHLQSTLALRTPRYYRHPATANKGPPPGETHKEMIEVNSRYYRHGNATLLCSQCEISLVFSLAIAGTTSKSWLMW